jgi:NAD(P)-dependent dehydrogenase (short-subunit alcohol dehydrogenase family)
MTKKTAVITGAASGIGLGLARYASAAGMNVVLADINEEMLHEAANSLKGPSLALCTDVSSESDIARLHDHTYAEFGQVDLLFNNAGVLSSGRCWEIDAKTWQRSLSINIGGIVNGLRTFVPSLLQANRPARIINTASVGGFFPAPFMGTYSVSKYAVVALTEVLAHELADLGSQIEVSLLAPGPVKTNILGEAAPGSTEMLMDKMRSMTDRKGMDADSFAKIVFQAIDAGQFWIVPQPESLDPRVRKRTEDILLRRAPTSSSKQQ